MFVVFDKRIREIGMRDWEETVFRSTDGVVIFRCTADSSSPHIHLVAVTEDLPQEGLFRIRLKRVLDEVVTLIRNMKPSNTEDLRQP
jgi:hypothetical protein